MWSEIVELLKGKGLDAYVACVRLYAERDLSQISSEGVQARVKIAQKNRKDTKKILSSKAATKFFKQSARIIARNTCLIIGRYLYLMGASLLEHPMKKEFDSFIDYYLKRIEDGAIVEDETDEVYCYVADSSKLITPYADHKYWEIERNVNGMSNNAAMLKEMIKQNRKIVLIRENSSPEYNGKGHTLVAMRDSAGEYVICDSFHGARFGRTMTERYHTNGAKWLRWIYGELNI